MKRVNLRNTEGGSEMGKVDVTGDFDFDIHAIDGDDLPIEKCACGATFDPWDFFLGIYPDRPYRCPRCNRAFCHSISVRIYEVVDG